MTRKVGSYELLEELGEGAFGKVWKARHPNRAQDVAVKVLRKEMVERDGMLSQLKKEISILKLINHPHIVQIHEVLASSSKIYLVQELADGGEMFDKIVTARKFDEKTARFYFQQMCVGVEYCHRQGICHRDLKPENLLLDKDDNLKITDFGLSALLEKSTRANEAKLLRTKCGTPNYVAPEVVGNTGYDGVKSDTWSCGVILYVFVAGFLPYEENDTPTLFRKIRKADYQIPKWFSNTLVDLLSKLMEPSVIRRWTITDVLTHPWWLKGGPYQDIHETREETPAERASREFEETQQPPKDDSLRNPFQNVETDDESKFLFACPIEKESIFGVLVRGFREFQGFISAQVNEDRGKLRAEFATETGALKIRAKIKTVSERPVLNLIVLKKVAGNDNAFIELAKDIELIVD